jgi:hypothetical protein
MRCATHPEVETGLTCATCGRPICPDCLVQTPVGMKCRDCGLAPPPPLYQVSPGALVVGVLVSALLGGLAGVGAWLVGRGAGLLLLVVGPLVGGVVGDVAWRTARRRGPVMAAAVAGACAAGIVVVAPQAAALAASGGLLGASELAVLVLHRPAVLLFAILSAVSAFWRAR